MYNKYSALADIEKKYTESNSFKDNIFLYDLILLFTE